MYSNQALTWICSSTDFLKNHLSQAHNLFSFRVYDILLGFKYSFYQMPFYFQESNIKVAKHKIDQVLKSPIQKAN